MKVLVLNCGSSSLKYQLLDMENENLLAKGLCERIGIDGRLAHQAGDKEYKADLPMPDHTAAVRFVLDALLDKGHGVIKSIDEVQAAGHRVVHGGEHFSGSVLIDEKVKKAIEDCCDLAPLHNPPNLIGINACEKLMPGVPQAAVFDTAFHQTMPPKAYLYAIPYELYEKYKIRKYGFHGTSHRYVAERAAAFMGRPCGSLKLITCHLGNGASVCAVNGGKSADTSMGFTPLQGLVMGTRSGDIDPAAVSFIMEKEGMTVKDVEGMLNKKSGVLGVSGVSSDFRDLEKAAEEGNARAETALEMFYYKVAKTAGEYAAALNGADAVVFTAGIGENSVLVRKKICSYFTHLGLTVDDDKNNCRGKEVDFSTAGSKMKALVIPTNEELVIARDTKSLLA